MAAIVLRNITDAKKWNLRSLWKASKNVSTSCLPALCWMPTLAVCLVLNVPDRPSYKGRECFGPMKGEGTAFLLWMARFKKWGKKWQREERPSGKVQIKEQKRKGWHPPTCGKFCHRSLPSNIEVETTVTPCTRLDFHGGEKTPKTLACRFSLYPRTSWSTESKNF